MVAPSRSLCYQIHCVIIIVIIIFFFDTLQALLLVKLQDMLSKNRVFHQMRLINREGTGFSTLFCEQKIAKPSYVTAL